MAASEDIALTEAQIKRFYRRASAAALRRGLRGAMRSEAARLRRVAVQAFAATGIHNAKAIADGGGSSRKPRGIRAVVFKDRRAAGADAAIVTIGTGRGGRGLYGRQRKPVLLFVNQPATSKGSPRRTRKGFSRGEFPYAGTDFMARVEQAKGESAARLERWFVKYLDRQIKRNGW